MEILLYALVALIGSLFTALIIAALMGRDDDEGTYGADEGKWPE